MYICNSFVLHRNIVVERKLNILAGNTLQTDTDRFSKPFVGARIEKVKYTIMNDEKILV